MAAETLSKDTRARLAVLYQEMGPEKLRADLQRSGWHQVFSDPETRKFAQQWLNRKEERDRQMAHLRKWLIVLATAAAGAAAGLLV